MKWRTIAIVLIVYQIVRIPFVVSPERLKQNNEIAKEWGTPKRDLRALVEIVRESK